MLVQLQSHHRLSHVNTSLLSRVSLALLEIAIRRVFRHVDCYVRFVAEDLPCSITSTMVRDALNLPAMARALKPLALRLRAITGCRADPSSILPEYATATSYLVQVRLLRYRQDRIQARAHLNLYIHQNEGQQFLCLLFPVSPNSATCGSFPPGRPEIA